MAGRRTIAVILAGGIGARVGMDVPKQLLTVAGKTILEHTVEAFDTHPAVDEILIVMSPVWVEDVRCLSSVRACTKLLGVIAGGATRSESTLRAIEHLGDLDADVLLHDAVRPLVAAEVITECVGALQRFAAVDVVIPSADTIVEVHDGVVTRIPDRGTLRRGQTPQGFRLSVLREAYARAGADPGFAATDDCGVVIRYLPDVAVAAVDGTEDNLKVTQPVDLFLADKLFQLRRGVVPRSTRDDYGERVRNRTYAVFGGSSGIGKDVAELLDALGARTFAFSRSSTGTDISRIEDVGTALEAVHRTAGAIDGVINTAALLHRGPLTEMSHEIVGEALSVNLLGAVNVARAAFPYLQESRGRLVLFTSSSHTRGRAGYSLYSATKAAIVNLTQALAEEWADDHVVVNCVNPERTATPMRRRAFGQEDEKTLLPSRAVALATLDALVADVTGQILDVRRADLRAGTPLSALSPAG